jgi:hypothetical protein
MAKYLVTVKDGRLGKARQIRPFRVEYEGLPGDLDKLQDVAVRHIARFAGTKRIAIAMEFPSDTAAIYTNVYCDRSETPIGRVKFDPIKEETA